MESFAENDAELALHRAVVIEITKERFCNQYWNIVSFPSEIKEPVYVSELLRSSTAHSSDLAGDEYEVDPCRRKYRELSASERHRQRLQHQHQSDLLRKEEARKLVTAVEPNKVLDESSCKAYAIATLGELLRPLGFELSKRFSSKNMQVFRKKITGDWWVSIAVYNDYWGSGVRIWDLNSGERVPLANGFYFFVKIGYGDKKTHVEGTKLYSLDLPVLDFTPLGTHVNSNYFYIDELTVALMAKVECYKIIEEDVFSRIKQVLSKTA